MSLKITSLSNLKNSLLTAFLIVSASAALSFAQSTLYVSPAGSDSNPGTVSQPLQTISKAMSMASAGTTIYLRGGTYPISSTLGAGVSGSAGNYINLWAYPGETPVLDFSGESYSASSRGIELKRNYWYLKGLVIKNAGDNGIYIGGNYNIVEDCSVSYCKDTGIQISQGASNNYIHNCDAFDNNDPATNGQNADGIDAKLDAGPGNVIRGCRVFDNSDDGYDCYGTANRVVFDSCWAFHNGYNLWNISGFTGNGNGFKLGGADSVGPHIVTNCVSFDNVVKGFDQNNNMAGLTIYNCTSFRNGTYNFSFPYAPLVGVDSFKNNISYDAGQADVRIIAGAVQDSNSWQSHTVTDADFLSLDTSLARLPRLSDGSLPSTAFLRLAPGSSLIDAGIDVGIPFTGTAPDLGAFENGTGLIVFSSNGKGGGDWNSTSTWSGGAIPDSADYVVILSGDSVSVSSTDTARCGDFTVLSGGKLGDSGAMSVRGTITLLPNSWFYNSNSKLPSLPLASSYSIDPASNYLHTSAAGGTIGASGYDSTFGNVLMLRSGTTCGANLTLLGNLIVNTGSSGGTFRATNSSVNRNLIQTVDGNVDVVSGQWSCVDGGNDLTAIWNVKGNVTVGDSSTAVSMARMGPFSSASSAHRLGIFNIGGNLSFVNGAKLQAGSSSGSTSTTETGIINLDGNLYFDSTAVFGTNSVGVFALNFVGPPTQTLTLHTPFVLSSSTMQPVVNDTIKAGSSVLVSATGKKWLVNGPGSFVVNGTISIPAGDTLAGGQNFSLADGATLGFGSAAGLDSTGPIQVTASKSFSTKANYVLNGTSRQLTGSWLPDTVNNLTIVNSAGADLTKPLNVNGTLGVVVGTLRLNGNDLVAHATNGGSTTRYVQADSTGRLRIPSVGSPQVLFPVGTGLGYAPVWVTNAGTPDTISVSVAPDSTFTSKNEPARVNLEWEMEGSSPTGNYTLQFGWVNSEEDTAFAANRAAYAGLYYETDSSAYAEAGSGSYTSQLASQPFTLSRGGITSLGRFVIGNFGTSAVESPKTVPAVFRLSQNYPNPFNPTTMIEFTVKNAGNASLKVYDILGQQVVTLFSGHAQPGKLYSAPFNAGEFASGVYFYVLESGGMRQIRKMVLMK